MEGPPLLPVSIEPTSVWAGATVQVSSPRIGADDSVRIYADSFPLPVRSIAGNVATLSIPGQLRGDYVVHFDSARGPAVGRITIAGFAHFEKGASSLLGDPFVLPGSPDGALLAGLADGTIVRFEPRSASTEPLLHGYIYGGENARGAGPTTDPNVVILQPHTGSAELWRVNGQPSKVGVLAFSMLRVATMSSDSTFLIASHHFISGVKYRASHQVFPPTMTWVEETEGMTMSPRGDRVAVETNYPVALVFNAQTGDTAYSVRALESVRAVAFSASGDTLYMLGGVAGGGKTLLLSLDATTGRELGRLELPSYEVGALTLDTDGSRLYAGVTSSSIWLDGAGTIHLLVMDAQRLSLLGEMTAPSPATPDRQGCFYSAIAFSIDAIYYECGGSVWTFDRQP